MKIRIPEYLQKACADHSVRKSWLNSLPDFIKELLQSWELDLQQTLQEGASCSWVAKCKLKDGSDVILKLGMPHYEGEHEIDGLKFWDGNSTVRLLNYDRVKNAMLLEYCSPGTSLKLREEKEQDKVIARILKELWVPMPHETSFRSLETMISYWKEEINEKLKDHKKSNATEEGIELLISLSKSCDENYLLVTDLHADNVLRSDREKWLVINPKPFVGERAFDATQHLLNCKTRLKANPERTIKEFSELLHVESYRVKQWLCARLLISQDPQDHILAWDINA